MFGRNSCGTPVLVAELPSRNHESLLIFVRYFKFTYRNLSTLLGNFLVVFGFCQFSESLIIVFILKRIKEDKSGKNNCLLVRGRCYVKLLRDYGTVRNLIEKKEIYIE